MNTQKDPAAAAGSPGSLFAAASAAPEDHDADEAEVEAQDETGEDDDGDEGDAAEVAAAAAQIAVDAPASGKPEPVGASHTAATAAPLSPTTRILPDEDEPYVFNDCTVNINIQLLPDDGDEDGREVIIAVSSHIEGPLVELTRQRLLGALPPPVAELVRLHEERLPALGEARAEARQRESSAKTSGAKSKTTVRGSNGKAGAGAKSTSASGGSAAASGPVTPVRGEQTALFDLMTGHRPKDDEGAGAAKEGSADKTDAPAQTPAASGGE